MKNIILVLFIAVSGLFVLPSCNSDDSKYEEKYKEELKAHNETLTQLTSTQIDLIKCQKENRDLRIVLDSVDVMFKKLIAKQQSYKIRRP